MKINQLTGLNRQAKKFLLDNNISAKKIRIMAFGFKGYINGEWVDDLSLIRKGGKWFIFRYNEPVLSISGNINYFYLKP